MENSSFERLVELIPARLLDESGKAFYAGREGFDGPKDIYLLGFNPGGDPASQADETVRANAEMLARRKTPWSAYLDEDWHGKAPIMRESVPYLARKLGLDLRALPASNLLFLRSAVVDKLTKSKQEIEDLCWPFHEAAISMLKCRLVICMGFSETGPKVCRRLNAKTPIHLHTADREKFGRSAAPPV